jgi:hypothetical protein
MTLLGMRAEGHGDSKTEAHPRSWTQMNLHIRMRDHTHTFTRLLQDQVTALEPQIGREARPKVISRRRRGLSQRSLEYRRSPPPPSPVVSKQQRGPSQKSLMCQRSSQSIMWHVGHVSYLHLWGTEIVVNLRGL